ncbi:uncharacterized protein LOC110614474 [Manihot esculenta]|uniref:uncharacterized protein LOC110614474 n=1 Tax=Manihot esculenta TaxID=3983 RepID=UPI000B5D1DD2|nr:uncharacterized protein LOC110614474 [Manihot esculenta]
MICFKCGRFGHVVDHCPAKTHSSNPDVPVTVTVVDDEGVDARFKDVNPKILEDFGTTPGSSSVRPAVSRQTAVEKEHVVVRGSRGSDEVHKWVVAQKDGRVDLANLENPVVSMDNHKDPQFPHPSAPDNVGIIDHNTMDMVTALLGASTSVNMGIDQAKRNGDVEGPVDNPMRAVSPNFRRAINEYRRLYKIDVIALLETRVSGSQADKICKDLGFEHWLRVEAFSFSGGIWVCWNNNGFELKVLNTHPQFVNCRIKPTWGSPWIVSFVYGSPNTGLRRLLWEDIRLSCLNMDEEWVVLGDFNVVVSMEEQYGYRTYNASGSRKFQIWLFDTALVDIGYEGVPFTWSRSDGRDGIKMARLDRGVCTTAWWRFAEARIVHPPKFHSDHCPIILSLGEQPLPNGNFFRCQAAWFAHPDFVDSVRTIWNHSNELWSNIESLQQGLMKWNREEFGNIFAKKRQVLRRIEGVQRALTLNGYSPNLVKLDFLLRQKMEEVLKQEELYWFQRSKEEWIVSGERNTKFYHLAAKVKKKRKLILAFQDSNVQWVTDEASLENLVVQFYKGLFINDSTYVLSNLEGIACHRIPEELHADLDKPYQKEEVA